MATPVRVPTFGMTEGEATIVEWLKRVGDDVAADEVLLIAENEKASLEVPSPAAGSVLEVLAAPGETVPLKSIVAWIGRPGEVVPSAEAARTHAEPDRVQQTSPPLTQAPGQDGWVKATPIARRLARQHGIDLTTVQGTGPGGRVKQADVEAVLARRQEPQQVSDLAVSEILSLTPIRRRTAERMAESFRTAPHFYLQVEVLASRLVDMRAELLPMIEGLTAVRLSLTDLMLAAIARVLPRHPLLNATWADGQVRTFGEVHLCVAVAGPQGLVAPIIHRAERLSLEQIVSARHALASKAQEGCLAPEDVRGGTFTLTNLGMYGIDTFIPILNPPQSAILAAGAIRERPVGEGGAVVLRPTLPLTLSADHRVVDGAQAAQFLADLRELLEAPARMLLEAPRAT